MLFRSIEEPALKLRADGMLRQRRLAGLPQPILKILEQRHPDLAMFRSVAPVAIDGRPWALPFAHQEEPAAIASARLAIRVEERRVTLETGKLGLHKINAVLVRPSAVAPLTLALHTPYRGGCVGIARPPDAGRTSVIAEQEPAHFIKNIEAQCLESRFGARKKQECRDILFRGQRALCAYLGVVNLQDVQAHGGHANLL